jgi:hypothetical protein
MTQYKYGTILRAVDDDPSERGDIEEGDLILKAGKHEDGHSYQTLTSDDIATVRFEAVAVYECPDWLSKSAMIDFTRDQYINETGGKDV